MLVGFYWLYLRSIKLTDYTIYYLIDVLVACAAGFIPQFSANTNRPFHIVNSYFLAYFEDVGHYDTHTGWNRRYFRVCMPQVKFKFFRIFRLRNIFFVCTDIMEYYEANSENGSFDASSTCNMLYLKYFIWLAGFVFLALVRFFGICLGIRAERVLTKRARE